MAYVLISCIYGSYLEFENAVDGCDHIFVWVTWFRNLYESLKDSRSHDGIKTATYIAFASSGRYMDLKQLGRIWFNHLSNFLLKRGYTNNDDCPSMFIKKSLKGFCIISVYVHDLNIVGTTEDLRKQ